MLVVADSTPLNILVRTELVGILPQLYGRILIPPAVASELSHPDTPVVIRNWLAKQPMWLQIRTPALVDPAIAPDRGEQEAICLARELQADLLLIDDKRARQAARRVGLAITGTLGVLEVAGRKGLIELAAALDRVQRTDFFISEELLKAVRKRGSEEKS